MEPLLQQVKIPEQRKKYLGDIVGFFVTDVVKERWVTAPSFKIKDFTKKSTKGENMKKAAKSREISVLTAILEEVKADKSVRNIDFNTNKFNQGNLNVIIEMVLRHYSRKVRSNAENPYLYSEGLPKEYSKDEAKKRFLFQK